MSVKNVRMIFPGIMLLALFFGAGNLSSAGAQNAWTPTPASPLAAYYVLSDGQFVYGPNIGDFVLKTYFDANAPHLSKYADSLYGRAEYYSINPKIYLTLLEIHSQLISSPNTVGMENPFGLNNDGFTAQVDLLSEKMSAAYYLHLYSFSALPVSQRSLPPIVTLNGTTINVPADTNAGTYAVIAGLAAIEQQNISLTLDNSQVNGFYQTYKRLFGSDDPLDEKNQIVIPGEVGALAAPDYLLQLPYLRGLSWRFGGVHNSNGCPSDNCYIGPFSSLDFYPWPISWGADTSSMWVVAAASGIPTKYPAIFPNTHSCGFKISHSGVVNSGWETTYYHLDIDPLQTFSNPMKQNDKIGVIANTNAQATCTGGSASGPHVHFSLKYNGAYVDINSTALSGWYVHAGLFSYDTNSANMWLERAGVKKYPSIPTYDVVLSEAPPSFPGVSSIVRDGINPSSSASVNFTVTFSESVSGVDIGDFSLTTTGGISGAVLNNVNGLGNVYIVTVYTGSDSGTIRLNVVDNNTIVDGTLNSLGGAVLGDGNFTTGEIYTINKFADVDIQIGGVSKGNYFLLLNESTRISYADVNGGPVKVINTSGVPIVASERVAYHNGSAWTSFSELMGLPSQQVTDTYYFPWYNNVDLNTQVRFANVGSVGTTVTVTVGGVVQGSYYLGAGASTRQSYVGLNSGPIQIKSSGGAPIIASERVAYKTGSIWTDFTEMMGLSAYELTDTYYFPWYNNVELNTQVRFANVGSVGTTVTVTIGGVVQGSYYLGAGASTRQSYVGLNSGPIQIKSSGGVPIIASERVAYHNGSAWTSFSELMGLPIQQVGYAYYFPWYNNVDLNTQVRFANVGSVGTTVTVTIGGVVQGSYYLGVGQSTRQSYVGLNSGPIQIQSSGGVPIIASERVAYHNGSAWTDFSELMGLSIYVLTDTYYFPWYNNVEINSQLRFAVP